MFNVTTKMCTCQIPAKIYKPTGCLCPSGMTLSPSNTCVCNTNSGYFMINGVCVKNNSSGPLQLTTLTGVITNGKSVNGNIRSIGGG